MALDEENLGAGYQDYELEDAVASTSSSHKISTGPSGESEKVRITKGRMSQYHQRAMAPQNPGYTDDLDDDVPQSLLIEDDDHALLPAAEQQRTVLPPPVPTSPTRSVHAKWKATQEQQRLHQNINHALAHRGTINQKGHLAGLIDPKEKAMWRWANVENLDNFLKDVYDYFIGNGIWCILLSRVLNLL